MRDCVKSLLYLLISHDRCSVVEWPWLFDSPFKLQMNNQGIFSPKELNQQIHESVENICLIEITNCVYCKNMLRVHDGKPSRN